MSNDRCRREMFRETVEVAQKRLDTAIEHAKNIQAGIYSRADIRMLENLAGKEIVTAYQDLQLAKAMLAAVTGNGEAAK